MATEFTLHRPQAEDESDEIGVLPIFDYTDWTFKLTVTRRAGTTPTLDVGIESSPLDDEDQYEDLVSFTQADQNTTLPFEETKSHDGDFTMPAGARFVRVDQDIGGTDPEWHYLLTATVTLFEPGTTAHVDLIHSDADTLTDLTPLAEQAESDVAERYLRTAGDLPNPRPWRVENDASLSPTAPDRLVLRADEVTGRRIREAIARRIDWLYRLDLLENNDKQNDHVRAERHRRDEWKGVDAILRGHDTREPLYMI